MDEPFKVGLYYISKQKTLVIGVPKLNLESLKFPAAALTFNLGDALATNNEQRLDVQFIQITNFNNYELISGKFDAEEKLWAEFLEFKKRVREYKKDAKILKIKKDDPQ